MTEEFSAMDTYQIHPFIAVPEVTAIIEGYCVGAIKGPLKATFELNGVSYPYHTIYVDSSKDLMEFFLATLKPNQVIIWRDPPQKQIGYKVEGDFVRYKWFMRYALVDLGELGFSAND